MRCICTTSPISLFFLFELLDRYTAPTTCLIVGLTRGRDKHQDGGHIRQNGQNVKGKTPTEFKRPFLELRGNVPTQYRLQVVAQPQCHGQRYHQKRGHSHVHFEEQDPGTFTRRQLSFIGLW
jgi:hypothetical protein